MKRRFARAITRSLAAIGGALAPAACPDRTGGPTTQPVGAQPKSAFSKVGNRTIWNLDPRSATIHGRETVRGTFNADGKCEIKPIPMTPQPKGRSSVIGESDNVLCEIVVYHVTFLMDKQHPLRFDTTVRRAPVLP